MTTIRKIVTSQVDGDNANNTDTGEIRPFGETAFYLDTNISPNKLTLMMFDGTRTHLKSKILAPGRLYGSDADAGDGSGADTIKLIPDAGLGTDQYIVVDPTGGEPGHIHLRAGGTQDSSGADLYIGGELNFVRISDTNKNVVIKTTSITNDTGTWSFNPQLSGEGIVPANITFPDGTQQTTAWAGGRVVNIPLNSTGADGNRAGDIAFDPTFFYYCTVDYVPNTFSTTVASPGLDINTIPVVKGNYGTPTTSWTVTVLGVEYPITNVTDGGDSWILTVDNFTSNGGTGLDVTLYNGVSSSNIWKRVGWSADTW